MDPYWAGALAHTVMAIMSLAGLLINRKFKKRPVYLTCCAILCFGTTTLWCQSVKLSENETNWHHQFLTYIMYLSHVFMYLSHVILYYVFISCNTTD